MHSRSNTFDSIGKRFQCCGRPSRTCPYLYKPDRPQITVYRCQPYFPLISNCFVSKLAKLPYWCTVCLDQLQREPHARFAMCIVLRPKSYPSKAYLLHLALDICGHLTQSGMCACRYTLCTRHTRKIRYVATPFIQHLRSRIFLQ